MGIVRALRSPVEARLEAIRADPASCFNLVSMYTRMPMVFSGVCMCYMFASMVFQARTLLTITDATVNNDDLCYKINYDIMKSYIAHLCKGVFSSRDLPSCKEHRATRSPVCAAVYCCNIVHVITESLCKCCCLVWLRWQCFTSDVATSFGPENLWKAGEPKRR